jgi:hypothetical protein
MVSAAMVRASSLAGGFTRLGRLHPVRRSKAKTILPVPMRNNLCILNSFNGSSNSLSVIER